MSISAASASAMQQGQIGQQIAMAVAGKQHAAMKQQGQAMVSLLEKAADVQRHMQSDIAVDGQAHKGQKLDVRG